MNSAVAATVSINLTGDTSGNFTNNTNVLDSGFLPLIDATTGLNQLPALTLNTGDTITGTVTLNNPITIAVAYGQSLDIVDVFLYGIRYPDVITQSSSTVSLYNNGVQLPPINGMIDASDIYDPQNIVYPHNIAIVLSNYSCLQGGTCPATISSFSFNEIDFSFSIENMQDTTTGQSVSSANFLASFYYPYLGYEVSPAPIPDPNSYILLLSGLGVIGALARTKRLPRSDVKTAQCRQ